MREYMILYNYKTWRSIYFSSKEVINNNLKTKDIFRPILDPYSGNSGLVGNLHKCELGRYD